MREEDFDEIIAKAGGCRTAADDSRSSELNADYFLNEAIIELKLIEEEGLDKENRRRKVAGLFQESQPDKPVVILDPNILSEKAKRKYYNLLEGPIKTHVKKAAKQLDRTLKSSDEKKI